MDQGCHAAGVAIAYRRRREGTPQAKPRSDPFEDVEEVGR
jgi:hypothetical protein